MNAVEDLRKLLFSQIIVGPLVAFVWYLDPTIGFLLSLSDIVGVVAFLWGLLRRVTK